MAYLETERGRSIYYEHHGGDGQPPVLFVHGWGASRRCWDLLLPVLLDAGHEVVSLDLRGCGQSDKDFPDFSMAALSRDVEVVARATRLVRPTLVGWSLGAAVVTQTAVDLGRNVGSLVLVGPPTPRYTSAPGFPHGNPVEVLDETLAALRGSRPTFLHEIARGMFHSNVGPQTVDWMWRTMMDASPRADASFADLGRLDQRALLPTLEMPAMICRGTNDLIVDPEIARVCGDLLPKAELVNFENSGHASFIEERDMFHETLLDFLPRES